jgi:xanthine dehydrogenase accessory factor
MIAGLAERESELLAGRVPFVHATVVRAQVPASARAGDGAIILSDGSIEGFVGGQCTEGAVRVAALGAIRSGESVLLRVLPDNEKLFPETPGARVVVNPCLSGGALEIFLQPRLPEPLLVLVGRSPIVAAIERQSPALGFVVQRADGDSGPAGATAVVVSSHGGDEPGAIRTALAAGVGFVGLVASPRRGSALLAEMGLTDAERGRVRSPVGLDIGARTADEIALSILAQIIQAIRREGLTAAPGSAEPVAAEPVADAVDPVCGMSVRIGPNTPHLSAHGEDRWFCGPGCRDHYAAEYVKVGE